MRCQSASRIAGVTVKSGVTACWTLSDTAYAARASRKSGSLPSSACWKSRSACEATESFTARSGVMPPPP